MICWNLRFLRKLKKSYRFSQGLIENVFKKIRCDNGEILDKYLSYGEILKEFIGDTALELFEAHNSGKSILFEGAQGISLDVTTELSLTSSSNTVAGHVSTGAGVGFRKIRVIGVVKAYVSRVGESPFPSEIHGVDAEELRKKERVWDHHR